MAHTCVMKYFTFIKIYTSKYSENDLYVVINEKYVEQIYKKETFLGT